MKTAQVLNIQRYCIHDGPGIRTTVFFKGCPLSCTWCCNPTTQKTSQELGFEESKCFSCGACAALCPQKAITYVEASYPEFDRTICDVCGKCVQACKGKALTLLGTTYTLDTLFKEVERDSIFFRNSGGGITLSGGELLLQSDFSVAFLKHCRNSGFHTAIETSSYSSWENLLSVAEEADYIMADIKHMDEEIHKKVTGVSNEIIIANLEKLTSKFPKTCLRIPIIPTVNTCLEDIKALALFADSLANHEVELLPYHPLGSCKYATIGKEYSLPIARIEDDEMGIIVETFRKYAPSKNVSCTG